MSLHDEGDKHVKVIMKYDRDLVEAMQNMGNDELKGRVLQSQSNLLESERQRKADDKLRKAESTYKDKKGPYDDAKKLQTAITNYGMLLLEERGVSLE
jgi:hypothetical protein